MHLYKVWSVRGLFRYSMSKFEPFTTSLWVVTVKWSFGVWSLVLSSLWELASLIQCHWHMQIWNRTGTQTPHIIDREGGHLDHGTIAYSGNDVLLVYWWIVSLEFLLVTISEWKIHVIASWCFSVQYTLYCNEWRWPSDRSPCLTLWQPSVHSQGREFLLWLSLF